MNPESKRAIKMSLKIIAIFIIGFIILIIGGIFLWWDSIKTNLKIEEQTEKIYGEISFEGSIMSIKNIRNEGRTSNLICIKIDSSNTNEFYRFDEYTCLKIHDSIATMPVGISLIDLYNKTSMHILTSAYVKVNMNNSRRVLFYNRNGDTISTPLCYRNSFKESDLNICNK